MDFRLSSHYRCQKQQEPGCVHDRMMVFSCFKVALPPAAHLFEKSPTCVGERLAALRQVPQYICN